METENVSILEQILGFCKQRAFVFITKNGLKRQKSDLELAAVRHMAALSMQCRSISWLCLQVTTFKANREQRKKTQC